MRRGMVYALMIVWVAALNGGVMDNAWLKGLTDKDPLSYEIGEPMAFTLTVQGLEGKLLSDEYFIEWTRSGDDGLRETGKVALVERPFIYSTKISKAGFVRLQARIVGKDGKAYVKRYTGDTTTPEGRKAMNAFERKTRRFFDGSAGADVVGSRESHFGLDK